MLRCFAFKGLELILKSTMSQIENRILYGICLSFLERCIFILYFNIANNQIIANLAQLLKIDIRTQIDVKF